MARPTTRASTGPTTPAARRATSVDLTAHRRARHGGSPVVEHLRYSVLDSLEAQIAVLDEHAVIIFANASWERFTAANGGGRSVGANYLEVCDAAPADDPHAGAAARGLRGILAGAQERLEFEYPCHAPDAEHWFILRATREHAPGPIRILVQHIDITGRHRAEDEARIGANLLDVVDVGIIATDRSGVVTHWNSGAERSTGWSAQDAVGRPLHEISVAPEDRELAQSIRAGVQETGRWEGRFDIVRRDGSQFPALVRNVAMTDSYGNAAGVVGFTIDLSEIVETERQLRSARDFSRAVTDSIGEGVCAIDADGLLVYVNPAAETMLGWPAAEIIGKRVHDVIHLHSPDATPSAETCPLRQAGRRGEAIRIEEDFFMRRDGTTIVVSCSTTPFEAPDGMRGTLLVFSDATDRKAAREKLEQEVDALAMIANIREALAEDRLVLHAQPIMDLATNEITQHELLIRMAGRDGTLIAPGAFLPVAEAHGLIVDIDHWVIRQAAELAARGNPVELNISAESLGRPELLDVVKSEVLRTGADPTLMIFELTETALLRNEDTAARFIAGIAGLGCGLALDDFGTGYGGFTYLKRFPVDYLKIDIEFVRDLPRDAASQHVVRAVVNLAKGFGQKTVAEGVEDAETLELLREYGVDYAQGYFLGRPAPLSETIELSA